jgi:hypothetical protein
MTGTIEWNDPAVIEPPSGPRPLIIAYVANGHRLVGAAIYFGGAFGDLTDGFVYKDVRAWAKMPDFPDSAG